MGSLDLYKDWASSTEPGFDIKGKHPMKKALLQPKIPTVESYNPEVSVKTSPTQTWPLDVRGLISSPKWLDQYGLRKNRLDLHSLLASLGFRHNEDFDRQLRKPISSKYGESLFLKHSLEDGSVYNIVAKKEQLTQVEERLQQAIALYKLRLEWLTSESRRIFGVIQEHCVTVVLDIKNLSPRQFDHFLCAVERVLKEQLSQVAKFNLIRCAEDIVAYSTECVPVTNDSVQIAIDWLWSLDRLAPTGAANTSEAILRASGDPNNEAVYLFTEGNSSDTSREVLRDKVRQMKVPLHVVSYNCSSSDTICFLRELTTFTGGRFHAYAVTMEVDSYEGLPVDPATNRANVVVRRKLYGGVPPGAGTRPDCLAIFEEMEEARNLLTQIQMLLANTPDPKAQYEDDYFSPSNPLRIWKHPRDKDGEPVEHDELTAHERREEYMSSREWLERFGLKARKLDFYDVLAGISFRHCDGVVDVRKPPLEEEGEEWKHDAIVRPKLVNAKYCDKFAHVRWKDGHIVHVQMTPEVHRMYEQRMAVAMAAIKRRIDWLRQGSRELFGTIVEEQVYILVDTSASMEPSLQFVKDKLFVLMQEQLRHKSKINLVAFNDKAYPWKDRLVDVTESTLQSAWLWIKALACYGSTNTLAALKFALSDRQTHAIYLLTDGRPNHPPKTVLSQVMLHNRVPVHSISFNCADKEANNFLCTLAKETGGRFHYFSETGDKDPGAPDAWESEDIRLLREEHDTGTQHLEKVTRLREECHRLAWNRDTHRKESQNEAPGSHRSSGSETERPKSAPSYERGAHASHRQSSRGRSKLRPIKASQPPKTSHTRTSLLRTLSKSGKFSSDEWMLPETQEMLDRQTQREIEAIDREDREAQKHKKKNAALTDESRMNTRSWLRKYGLIPQRLTILDALAPTVVEQRPKYVPILDKEVLSKVFDDVLPIAHVSKTRKGCISLVNPKAVNLEAYKEKLLAAIKQYEKKLLDLIKRAIGPQEVDAILMDTNEEELHPEKHREAILDAMERTGWKVSESDLTLLEKEIVVARKYLAQAEDLERAGKEEEAEKRKKKTSVSTPGEGFGEVLKMHQGGGKEEKGVKKVLDSLRGQYVIARDERDGLYYPGHVTRCPNVRVAHVGFDGSGKSEADRPVPTRFCIPISGAIARPNLQLRDTVLTRCNNADNGRQCYAPGIITGLPSNPRSQAKFFTVKLFTGKKCQSLRNDLVKIGQTRYNFIVQNLYEKGSSVSRPTKSAAATNGPDKASAPETCNSATPSDVEDAVLQDHLAERDRLLGLVTEHEAELDRQTRTVEELQTRLTEQQEAAERRQREMRKELRRMKKSAAARSEKDKARVQDKVAEHERMIQSLMERLEQQQREKAEKEKEREKDREERRREKEDRRREKEERIREKEKEETDEEEEEEEENEEKAESSRRSKFGRFAVAEEEAEREAEEEEREAEADAEAEAESKADADAEADAEAEAEAARSGSISGRQAHVQEISVGEEVLARWLDDGWYYRGLVRRWHGDGSYTIEDGSGQTERIWREDLIRDRDDVSELTADTTVVALHPGYCFSYSPAVVTKVLPSLWAEVRFYDGVEAQLPREECYRMSSEKFEAVVRFIVDSEKQWVDQAVVARDPLSGSFHLAQVKQRIGSGKQYIVEWADGRLSTLTAEFMFGAFTRRRAFRHGDRVLACADLKGLTYLPGWVSGITQSGNKLTVRFCNGTKLDNVDIMHSFWLSSEYYEQAVRYWKKKSG